MFLFFARLSLMRRFSFIDGLASTYSKVVELISDPNLYKCMVDPDVIDMLNRAKRGLGTAQFSPSSYKETK